MSQNIPFHFGSADVQHQQHSSHTPPTNGALVQPPQMAAAQNGALPGIDMSVLQGISPQQLALIAHLLQTGQIPLPPPPPTGAAGTTSSPSSQSQQPQTAQVLTAVSTKSRAEADVDMDKEEGELEEGEVGDSPASREFLRTPPKGPRKRSGSPRSGVPNIQDLKRRSQQSPRFQAQRPPTAPRRQLGLDTVTIASQLIGDQTPEQQLSKDTSIKSFIVEMHKAGFTFDQVAKEVNDATSLRRLYQQFSIPLTATASGEPPADTAKSVLPVTENQRKVSAMKRPVPAKAPASQDRSEYLAKLQAAKNKKSELAVIPPLTAEPQQKPAGLPIPNHNILAANTAGSKGADRSKGKIKVDNDLVRQRLEAFRAQQAAKQNAAKPPSETANPASLEAPSTVALQQKPARGELKAGLGDGLVEAAAQATDEASGPPPRPDSTSHAQRGSQRDSTSTTNAVTRLSHADFAASASPTLNRGFGLPGLFTTMSATAATSQQRHESTPSTPLSGTTTKTIQQPLMPASRPCTNSQAPARVYSPVLPPPTPPVRNQSYRATAYQQPYQYEKPAEQFIIENSDDEESGEEMEIDDSENEEHKGATKQPADTIAMQKTSPFIVPAPSSTLTTASRRNLDDMKYEEMKRLIALHEEKRRKTGKEDFKSTRHDSERSSVVVLSSAPASRHATPITEPVTISGDRAGSVNASTVSATSQKHDLQLRMAAAERELAARKHGSRALTPIKTAEPAADVFDLASGPVITSVPETTYDVKADSGLVKDGDTPDEFSSDEDEAMYAEPSFDKKSDVGVVVHSAVGLQGRPMSASVTPQTHEPVHEGSTRQGASSLGPVATMDNIAYDAASLQSEDENAMYQIPNVTQEQAKPVEHSVDDLVEQNVDEEDDLDDVYEPAESSARPNASIAIAPVERFDEDQSRDKSEFKDQDDRSDENDNDDDDSEDAMDTSDELESNAEIQLQQELNQASGSESSHNSSPQNSADGDNTDGDVAMQSPTINDELAQELQPPKGEPFVPSEEPRKLHSFEAYKSPLASFKDFRYHSDYLNTVSGGFKSLTYSNKIDPDMPVCPWELAGGACYDKTCECQHFRTMGLTDNDLLRAMGTEKIPARTPDEEQRWKSGLNGVVQELRNTNQGRDVLAIARRIAEYRREFREDPTKTLLLD